MKSALHTLALTIMLASTVTAQQNTAPGTKKLYIEEHIETTTTRYVEPKDNELGSFKTDDVTTTRNVSLSVTNDVMKQCSSLVSVTDNRDAADYVLHIVSGSSTLTRQDGSVAYTSKSKWKNSNLAKDVCKFVGSQK
jgi:hypothetical protein